MGNIMALNIKKVSSIFIAFVLILNAAGCSLRPQRKADEPFRLGFRETADNLNPYGADGSGEAMALSLLYDTLFVYDPATGECNPGLCVGQHVSQNADGSYSWDLEIRSGVYWHDGRPLTAKDVMFTLKTTQLFSRLYSSPNCDFIYGGNMTVLDDTHLSFVVWDDYAYMEEFLADIPILPEHIWNALPYMQYTEAGQAADHAAAFRQLPMEEANASTMIGSGPWRWGGYKDGVCRLFRNENYWNGPPTLKTVELVFNVTEPVEQLLNQSVDALWELPADELPAAEEAGFLTGSGSSGNAVTLEFNFSGLTSDPVLREAVDAALNREEIISVAFDGGDPTPALMPPGSVWHDLLTMSASNADPAWLLEQSGYTDRDGDGFREMADGSALSLTLLCPGESSRWSVAAECIRRQCAAAGIRIEIKPADSAAVAGGVWDMLLSGWNTGNDPASLMNEFYWDSGDNAFYTKDNLGRFIVTGWNITGYDNAEYDRMYAQFIREKDMALRQSQAEQLASMIGRDRPMLVLGWPVQHQACASQWKEFHQNSGLLYTQNTLRQVLSEVKLK